MQTLTTQLQGVIAADLDQHISLADLRDWLEEHVGALAGTDDPAFVPFAGRVWLWLSEFDLGDRPEPDLREQLTGWLRGADPGAASAAAGSLRAL